MDRFRCALIHFPKSGGSSLKKSIKDSKKGNILLEYYKDDPVEPHSDVRNDLLKSQLNFKSSCEQQENFIIYGHFSMDSIKKADLDIKLTMLRHPISWILSLNNFWRGSCSENLTGHHNFLRFCKSDKSLLALLEIDEISNIYTKTYFNNSQPSDFTFVGFQEDFSQSVAIYSKILGVELIEQRVNLSEEIISWNDTSLPNKIKIKRKLKQEIEFYKDFRNEFKYYFI